MLQTERDDTAPNLAYILLEEEFDALVSRKWGPLAKKFGIELAEIQLILIIYKRYRRRQEYF